MDQQAMNAWLPILSLVGAALSAVIVWGFATGRFVQKAESAQEKVSRTENALRDEAHARASLAESINATMGKLQNQFNLLEQAHTLRSEHLDLLFRNFDVRMSRLEEIAASLQRQVDRKTSHPE